MDTTWPFRFFCVALVAGMAWLAWSTYQLHFPDAEQPQADQGLIDVLPPGTGPLFVYSCQSIGLSAVYGCSYAVFTGPSAYLFCEQVPLPQPCLDDLAHMDMHRLEVYVWEKPDPDFGGIYQQPLRYYNDTVFGLCLVATERDRADCDSLQLEVKLIELRSLADMFSRYRKAL